MSRWVFSRLYLRLQSFLAMNFGGLKELSRWVFSRGWLVAHLQVQPFAKKSERAPLGALSLSRAGFPRGELLRWFPFSKLCPSDLGPMPNGLGLGGFPRRDPLASSTPSGRGVKRRKRPGRREVVQLRGLGIGRPRELALHLGQLVVHGAGPLQRLGPRRRCQLPIESPTRGEKWATGLGLTEVGAYLTTLRLIWRGEGGYFATAL